MSHIFSDPCPGTFYRGGICCDDINEVNLNGFCQMQCPTNYKLNEFVCECANNFKGLNPLFEEEGRLCCPEGQISSVNAKGFPKCAEQCPKNYVANTDGKFLSNFKAIVPAVFKFSYLTKLALHLTQYWSKVFECMQIFDF